MTHIAGKDVHTAMGKWWGLHPSHPQPPSSIEHKANYVLYPAELAEYEQALSILGAAVEKERMRVRKQLRIQRTGHHLFNEDPGVPYTLCDALNFMLGGAKVKLFIMQWLTSAAQRRTHLLGEANEFRSESKFQDR